jgi:2-oxoglutarate ferredoxin oxidoreductase subunit alpha
VDEIADFEGYKIENCQIGLVSYGCTSRAIYEAVENAEKEGIKTGYIRLKTLWPFPEKAVRKMGENAEKIIVPEMNLRQMFYEVERVVNGSAQVVPLNKIGGGELITPEELTAKIQETVKKND